ncbi:MAG TPA: TIGR00366 family protein [Segeticoccus sp.]|uniref:short-chain fatty acid transporter n=1 Tax=Segeticoccus sp. TaxID=2706531 RepID=UPI002D7F6B5A|nr:TIGR00366 family protein [Segeticoccus sp.]HET8602124.1 TIGR00366 family protein [Segeticoccus sp.]
MLRALSRPLVRGVERYLPGSLVFAVILTFIVGILALALTDAGPVEVVRSWGDGLTGLLAFMTQMALILLLGYVLANTRPVRRLLNRLAALPQTPVQAYAFVTFTAAVASLITWGLGLVVAALLSVEVARSARTRGLRLHYPLLVACGYSGFVVWHMGYSGSGPLAAATPGSFVDKLVGRTIPVSETIFSTWNMLAALAAVVLVTAAMAMLRPGPRDRLVELPEGARLASEESSSDGTLDLGDGTVTPAERIDASRVVTTLAGVALAAYLVIYFAQEGFALTLDIVNWTFLALILLLVRSPKELGGLVADAGRNVGDILLQFPLYAGILGMMVATGLIEVFSNFFVHISSPATLGLWAFLSGGLVNMFVPSGGGQFAVQAPIFFDAAKQLGVDPAVVTMGIAYGDQWTNMIQPFWAIPLLAIARLRIRDVLGFTTVTLIVSGVVFAVTMVLVGAG